VGTGNGAPRESELFSRAEVIKRSRLFFTVPVVIIGLLAVNLVWEILRDNLSAHTLMSWPYRFTIMDNATTATVLAVFISFIRWYARGAPFPAVKRYSEGMQVAYFTVKALTVIRIFDVRITYIDSLGDVHEKVTPE
jgi:hypothetical protein